MHQQQHASFRAESEFYGSLKHEGQFWVNQWLQCLTVSRSWAIKLLIAGIAIHLTKPHRLGTQIQGN
jgi:hypothetical protein